MATAVVPNLEQGRFGYLKPKDVARLAEAYRFSEAAHAGQTRQSGDPYSSHPLAVAEILADWHLDGQTLMAALLHDVTEDTSVTKDEISDTFGKPVAELVDGVSKLDKIEFQSAEVAQAENFRKMLLAMARDVRIILIKLADRLHNMRTLAFLPQPKREQKARETLEILAPLLKVQHPVRSSVLDPLLTKSDVPLGAPEPTLCRALKQVWNEVACHW